MKTISVSNAFNLQLNNLWSQLCNLASNPVWRQLQEVAWYQNKNGAIDELKEYIRDQIRFNYEYELPKNWSLPMKDEKFQPGTVVVWDCLNLNDNYWTSLSEKERKKYYGALGYGLEKKKLFVFLTAILDADGEDSGHCILVDLDDGHLETMRHTNEFRKATEEEF